jgi:Flp pilus assembly pilin Flp
MSYSDKLHGKLYVKWFTEKNAMEDTSMKKLMNFSKKLANNESGQGATEYILLLVVIVGLVVMFGPKLKEIVTAKVGELSSAVSSVKP